MLPPVSAVLLTCVPTLFRARATPYLENLALRHQLAVYQQTVRRPRLRPTDRLFWVCLSRLWSGWQGALMFVQPRTVIAWQRKRFRTHWCRLSQRDRLGRPLIAKEVRTLIQDMWRSNPTWGAPRIVGELHRLGIDVAKSTVEKYRLQSPKPLSPTWNTFLSKHAKDLVALDFFTVPIVTCKVLFVLVILVHARRRIIHVIITDHPTTQWTAQQVVEAFPWDEAPRYLRRNRDGIYGTIFRHHVRSLGIEEVLTTPRSLWQNPYVERFIGSICRECLDHLLGQHAQHLKRVLPAYIIYYHHFGTHLSLVMDCPEPRPIHPPDYCRVTAVPEVGGLRYHYERQAAYKNAWPQQGWTHGPDAQGPPAAMPD
jgi:transposase InsO family protein